MKRCEKTVLLLIVVFLLLFIWGNSMLPGELSGRESGWVQELLRPVLEWLAELGVETDPTFLVRKTAHFTEYMLFGFFLSLLLRKPDGQSRPAETLLLCALTAAVDEAIQIFAPDRGPGVKDAALDFCGAVSGMLIALAVMNIVRRRLRRGTQD